MAGQFVRAPFFSWGAAASAILFAAALMGAELPPEIQVDRLLVQAEREMESGEHWSAVFTFERILEVCEEHGLDIPTEFWFRQAGVLHSAGLHERAIQASTRYLQEAGRDGENYLAALDILDAAEVSLTEAQKAEKLAELRQAARDREKDETGKQGAQPTGVVQRTTGGPVEGRRCGALDGSNASGPDLLRPLRR